MEVRRMASWMETTVGSGGPSSDEKGASAEAPHYGRVFRTVSPAECFELLEPGGIGRVGFTAADGVVMLPVNFAVSGRIIVFRTAPDTLLALHARATLTLVLTSVSRQTTSTKSSVRAGACWYTAMRTWSQMSVM
jgi:hypothetical protein